MKKILLVLMAFFVISVGYASAYPTVVTGTVYDSSMNPVSGASVTVVCEHNGTNSTQYTSSIMDGTYIAQFYNSPTIECGYGDQVWVSAEYNSMTGTATGYTCDVESQCPIPVALVDVQIPEFGVVAAGLALIGAIAIFAIRRKN
ncbi:MAG: hypothetical protein KatS3mg002_1531 [Candidatus Woesearchaeota archaeon]|nr:MAG: hypothetical protein KatS3mg002_1531 [Candidatus Woesearchaeota archaeon]